MTTLENGPSVQLREPNMTSVDELHHHRYDGEVRRATILLGSPTVAHDVVADAFCEVINRWHAIDNPAAYLSRSVLHGCQRAAKKRAKEIADDQVHHAVPSHVDRPHELVDAVRALPWSQRAVVVLKFYEGLGEREIAERLDMRPGSVGPTLTRAMRKLRKEISS